MTGNQLVSSQLRPKIVLIVKMIGGKVAARLKVICARFYVQRWGRALKPAPTAIDCRMDWMDQID
jgi:hypothetical protein